MTDQRTYIKFHDGMPEHPKIDPLSDKAFRVLVDLWCWCSRNLTDGQVPDATWKKRSPARVRKELLDAELVEETPAGVFMHDYLDWQRSADEVRLLREARAAAGKRGGKAKAKPQANDQANAKQTGSKTEAETELETETENPKSKPSSPNGDIDALFEQFWTAYPKRNGKRVGKAPALKVWRRLSDKQRAKAMTAVVNYAAAVDQGLTIARDAQRFLANRDGIVVEYLTPATSDDEPEVCEHGTPIHGRYPCLRCQRKREATG